MKPFTTAGIERLTEQLEPDIRLGASNHVWTCPGETESWMVDRLIEHRNKRLEEAKKEQSNGQ